MTPNVDKYLLAHTPISIIADILEDSRYDIHFIDVLRTFKGVPQINTTKILNRTRKRNLEVLQEFLPKAYHDFYLDKRTLYSYWKKDGCWYSLTVWHTFHLYTAYIWNDNKCTKHNCDSPLSIVIEKTPWDSDFDINGIFQIGILQYAMNYCLFGVYKWV